MDRHRQNQTPPEQTFILLQQPPHAALGPLFRIRLLFLLFFLNGNFHSGQL